MEKAPPPNRPRHDAAFRAEALCLASESRSTLAAARALNINAKLLYQWQKAAQKPLPTDPAEAAEVRALRTANKRLAQEPDILKKLSSSAKCLRRIFASPDPMGPLHFIDQQRVQYPVQQLCRMLGVVPSRYYAWRHASAVGAVGQPNRPGKRKCSPCSTTIDAGTTPVASKSNCGKRATAWTDRP